MGPLDGAEVLRCMVDVTAGVMVKHDPAPRITEGGEFIADLPRLRPISEFDRLLMTFWMV